MNSSIIQLATPRAVSAIHIIRISGSESLPFLHRHIDRKEIVPRQFINSTFNHNGKLIDRMVCFYLPAPKSYTGEDMVELHCHGSLLIVDQILNIALQEGLQLAEPGEFTFRAFLNGKLTLEASEAIDTLIKSTSEVQKQNALHILEQKSSLKFDTILDRLLSLLAELESTIEFPEEDIPEIDIEKKKLYQHYTKECETLKYYFKTITENYRKGKKIDSGIKVVLIGSPNVGKSTLMNLLLRDDRSITSSQAGTTRDYLSEYYQLGAFKIKIFDTAGIHHTDEEIEKAGIEKSLALIESADLLVWLVSDLKEITELEKEIEIKNNLIEKNPFIYFNKTDQYKKEELDELKQKLETLESKINVAGFISLTKEPKIAVDQIESNLLTFLEEKYTIENQEPALLNERQAIIVEKILNQLSQVLTALQQYESEELIMEEFKIIIALLNEINLKLDHEKIYDHLFSKFCLGK